MPETSRRVVPVVCLVGLAAALAGATGPALAAQPQQSAPLVGSQQPGPGAWSQQSTGTLAGQAGPRPGAAVQSAVDPDVVVMRVALDEDGTAAWSVAYRTRLDDENTTAAFESLRADIEENASAFTDRFAAGMGRTVDSAENRTGREMALRNVTVEATKEELGQTYGVVTYRFTWTGFAAVDGDRIRAGDALSGLFLDSETSLVVEYPDGYDVAAVTPRPDENRSNAVVWRGQLDFGPDQPRLALTRGGAGPGTPALVGVALGLLALLAVGWVARSRVGTDWLSGTGAGDDSGGTTDADGVATDDETAAGGAGEETGGGDDGDGPPPELLSNEERVLRLLDEEGGRIKQQRIAAEFDWTDAKTSQVVGGLRDEGAVETFRIGRENVVTLPEESDL